VGLVVALVGTAIIVPIAIFVSVLVVKRRHKVKKKRRENLRSVQDYRDLQNHYNR
jgi:hypothetical protein